MSGGRLEGKRVVVTGAAKGIGRAFALRLAAEGARVLAADVDAGGLAEVCSEAEAAGATAIAAQADVSSSEQTLALGETAREEWGGLDGLVNNAAVIAGLRRRPFDQVSEEEWDRVLEVNVKGAWLCARAAVPLMRAAGGGSIVNLASEVAYSGSPGLVHYVASKAAMIGLTRVLAKELGPEGIRANAIAPGYMETEGTRALSEGVAYDTGATALGRLGEPEDLLGAAVFLLSDESAFVSGQTLLVNGGRILH